jgi:O-antigen/teichoic acid export membrane protein
VAAPPALAVLIAGRGQQDLLVDGPVAEWAELTPNMGWLVGGSVLAAILVNGGPVMAGILKTPSQADLVSHFTYAVVITRVPLFLFQAVQAALLPRLAKLAARGALDEFRDGFRRLMHLVILVGILGVAGSFVLGPFVIEKFYGARLTHTTVTALAIGSTCYMVALATAQAVIALQGHALVAAGWTIAMAVFVVVTATSSHDLYRRVEFGLVAGCAAAMAAFAIAFRMRLRAGGTPSGDSVMDALTDMPFET